MGLWIQCYLKKEGAVMSKWRVWSSHDDDDTEEDFDSEGEARLWASLMRGHGYRSKVYPLTCDKALITNNKQEDSFMIRVSNAEWTDDFLVKLRDTYAIAALQGLIASDASMQDELFETKKDACSFNAELAYAYADAMLRAREGKK